MQPMSPHPPQEYQPNPETEAELLGLHAKVLFDMVAGGRLAGINEEGAENPPPRLFLARGRT